MINYGIMGAIMTFSIRSPCEVAKLLAHQLQEKRLSFNYSQKTLSARSGVSFGVLKKFERTGKISLEALLKLALVLDSLEEFENLFKLRSVDSFVSLDELMKDTTRKRGRQ